MSMLRPAPQVAAALTIALLLPHFLNAAPSSCDSLAKLVLPDTAITLAQPVPAGAFTLPSDLRPDQLNAPGVTPAAVSRRSSAEADRSMTVTS